MSKYNELRKKTMKTAVMASIVVFAVAGIYALLSVMGNGVAEDKASVEGRLTNDTGLLASLREQLDKSGAAEKRYSVIQENRTALTYSAELEVLTKFLANLKGRYKFDAFKIQPVEGAVSDKPELANFNYDIQVWHRFGITLKAVSDVHVFSFLQDFRTAVPGFIRIDLLEIKRFSDLTDPVLSSIKDNGKLPLTVDAKIQFTWIGLAVKEKKKPSNPPTP